MNYNIYSSSDCVCLICTLCAAPEEATYTIQILDINECAQSPYPCHVNGSCVNNIGSYQCICKDGFSGDGKSCTGK